MLAFIVFLFLKKDHEALLISSYEQQHKVTVSTALRMNEDLMMNILKDYSVWDEMVKFTMTRDSLWARVNISSTPITYGLSGMWVVDRDNQIIYSYTGREDPIQPLQFFSDSLFSFIDKRKGCYFYHKQSFRVYEMAASPIHLMSDTLKSEPAAGYFILCRALDQHSLRALEKLTISQVVILPYNANHQPASDPAEIVTIAPLNTWNGRTISLLEFRHEQPLLRSYLSHSWGTGVFYLVFAFTLALLVYYALYKWLNIPLKKITESLAFETADPIRDLTLQPDEFGQISVMIRRFFEQKKELAGIIHEKNEALTSLAIAESKNRALLAAIPDHLFRINIFGVITDYHILHPEDLPVPIHFIKGKNYEEILPQHISAAVKKAILDLNQTTKTKTVEFALPSSKGPTRYFETTLSLTGQGDYLAVLRNITERKEAEMALFRMLDKEADLNRLKTHFISTVSHEFRTPLSAISSNVQLLEMYGGKWPNDKKATTLHRIQQAVSEMTSLIDDLTLIARDQSGKLKSNPVEFDLRTFCKDLIRELPIRFEFPGTIAFEYECHSHVVCIDKELTRHILTNLLSNAMKFSPAGNRISFIIKEIQETSLTFIIADNGIGISPDDLASIFEPFHRGENAVNVPGTGLGLSIVKRCVEMMHGSITFESEQGKGTTVTVIIPWSTKPTEEP
jgi:signal transduction histidine kinase